MTLRACGLTLLVLLAAAGCGGGGGSSSQTKAKRNETTAYIKQIDLVQEQLRLRLTRASQAYRSFSIKPADLRRERAQFAAAATTFETLDRRLSRVTAQPVVRPLRSGLLRLVRAEASLARELASFAGFLPRFRAALAPLAVANVRLTHALGAIKTPHPHAVPRSQLKAARAAYAKAVAAAATRQAAAVNAYVATIAAIDRVLAALQPPAVLAPTYVAQRSTLAHVRATGNALASALRDAAYTKVAVLDRSFRAAALGTTTLAAQRAERAAVSAYDEQVHRVGVLTSRVAAERSTLQKTLG